MIFLLCSLLGALAFGHASPSIDADPSFQVVDISVRRGPDPPPPPAHIDCSFNGGPCGWMASEPWSLSSTLMLPCPINGPPHRLPSDGSFMGAQGRFGSLHEGNLSSPWFAPCERGALLSFKYSKQTANTRVEVWMHEEDDDSWQILDSITQPGILQWNERQVVVPASGGRARIVFSVSGVDSASDVVGVDDVRFRPLAEGELTRRHSIITPVRRSPEVRRAPAKPSLSCSAIACDFSRDYCSWTPSGSYSISGGKAVVEGPSTASLTSPSIDIPAGALLQFDVFTSDSATVSVIVSRPTGEESLWTNAGLPLTGWTRMKVPIRHSSLPSSLIIRSSLPKEGFVAVSKIDLVDALSGASAFCGQSISVIRPDQSSSSSTARMTRLTAVQSPLPLPSDPSPLPSPPLLHLPSPPSFGGLLSFPPLSIAPVNPSYISSPSISSLPISPSIVRSSPSLPFGGPLPFYGMNPISNHPGIDGSMNRPISARDSLFTDGGKSMEVVRRDDRLPPSPPPRPSVAPRAATPPKSPSSPSFSQLISSIGGQPILEGQLKHIAKKFGFDSIHGERAQAALAAAKRLFGEEEVATFLAKAAQSAPRSFSPPAGVKPILPINVPSEGGETHSVEEVEVAPSPLGPSLNSALAERVNSFVALPSHSSTAVDPLARANADFFVHNNAVKGIREQDIFWRA